MNRDSSVSTVTDNELDDWGSMSSRGKYHNFHLHHVLAGPDVHLDSSLTDTRDKVAGA
jgi:hypothetical protein